MKETLDEDIRAIVQSYAKYLKDRTKVLEERSAKDVLRVRRAYRTRLINQIAKIAFEQKVNSVYSQI